MPRPRWTSTPRCRSAISASDDAEFTALRAGWRADIPADAPVDHAKAAKVLALMAGLLLTVLCQIWIGLTDLAAIAAFVISKVPLVTVMVHEGALRPDLDDMAQAF